LVALVAWGELGPKVRDYRRNKIMTVTKNRGPKKPRYNKLIVDIGRNSRYGVSYAEEEG